MNEGSVLWRKLQVRTKAPPIDSCGLGQGRILPAWALSKAHWDEKRRRGIVSLSRSSASSARDPGYCNRRAPPVLWETLSALEETQNGLQGRT